MLFLSLRFITRLVQGAATFILIIIEVGVEEILTKPARHLYKNVIAHGSIFKIFIAFYN